MRSKGKIAAIFVAYLVILCAGGFLAHLSVKEITNPPIVEAQGFEPFARTFTISPSVSTQYIPACTTGSTRCIPNFKQVAHTVIISTATQPSAACAALLDYSSDDTNFLTFAAGTIPVLSGTSVTFSANGYYPYVRLKVLPCNLSETISYIGYSTPLPLSFVAQNVGRSLTTATNIFSGVTPYTITGFQCYNTNSTAAFMEFIFSATNVNPGLGPTSDFMDVQVPATSSYIYAGAPLSPYSLTNAPSYIYFWSGAATTYQGSTGVTNPVYCNFQFNSNGPYSPFNLPSP